jgi:hypothetical protein
VSQSVQLVGALAILAAFAAAQARKLDVSSLLLEAAWAVVSVNGLAARWRSALRARASR